MVKYIKYTAVVMAIITVAALNLSTSCAPAPVASTNIADVARYRTTLPSVEETFASAESEDAPKELTWKQLTDVDFRDVYVEELDAYYWQPTFGESVKALEGQEVYITGYIIPVDYDEDFYVVSRYPFANCFFCGGAGPESVVDLRFKSKTRKYETDERLTFKGTFKLNADDVYQMNYILDGCTEHRP